MKATALVSLCLGCSLADPGQQVSGWNPGSPEPWLLRGLSRIRYLNSVLLKDRLGLSGGTRFISRSI